MFLVWMSVASSFERPQRSLSHPSSNHLIYHWATRSMILRIKAPRINTKPAFLSTIHYFICPGNNKECEWSWRVNQMRCSPCAWKSKDKQNRKPWLFYRCEIMEVVTCRAFIQSSAPTQNTKADMWYSLQLCCLCLHIRPIIRFNHVCLICLA